MGFGNMEVISILDKSSFSGLSLVTCSSDHRVFPFRDWWGPLRQLDQLSPQSGGTVFEALSPDWTTLSRLAPAACLLGGMEVPPGQLTLSDPLNTVPLRGP